jgi:hypothetical protein
MYTSSNQKAVFLNLYRYTAVYTAWRELPAAEKATWGRGQ